MQPARTAVALFAAASLAGCMSRPATRVHYMDAGLITPGIAPAPQVTAQRDPRLRLATLGAGDVLGRSVYQNDVHLAYLAEVSNTLTPFPPVRLTGAPDAP